MPGKRILYAVPEPDFLTPPSAEQLARFDEGFGTRFLVTVDTEEEFDWDKPFQRAGHTLLTVPALRKFQEFCEGHRVAPVYLVDYPAANSPLIAKAIGDAVQAGKAEVGIQLHPWVSPPFEEEVSAYNSYAGNLPPTLENDKLVQLKTRIETVFGTSPQIYRAGRYGLGPNTAGILHSNAIAVDTSVRAHFDYSSEGGPNFGRHTARPYWVSDTQRLLELPLTTVYAGLLRRFGPAIHPRLWRVPMLRGLLARTGLLERISLTPEGITAQEALRGVDTALAEGLPLLVFSFHSPSLVPGHTPYVRNEDDLDTLYDWWRVLFEHLARRGVQPASVGAIMNAVTLS